MDHGVRRLAESAGGKQSGADGAGKHTAQGSTAAQCQRRQTTRRSFVASHFHRSLAHSLSVPIPFSRSPVMSSPPPPLACSPPVAVASPSSPTSAAARVLALELEMAVAVATLLHMAKEAHEWDVVSHSSGVKITQNKLVSTHCSHTVTQTQRQVRMRGRRS